MHVMGLVTVLCLAASRLTCRQGSRQASKAASSHVCKLVCEKPDARLEHHMLVLGTVFKALSVAYKRSHVL